jgi:hypothetical protein
LKAKEAGTQARKKEGGNQLPDTKQSRALADYAGDYDNPAYGLMKIGLKDGQLQFDFHKVKMPMMHFHYDRFDTPNDEQDGKWSVNFRTNPQGDISEAVMSLDEAEVLFSRKPEGLDPKVLAQLAGSYETPTGLKVEVAYLEKSGLTLVEPGASPMPLAQVKGLRFRTPQFSDVIFEFVMQDGQVKALKQTEPSGEYSFPRK